PHSFVKTPGVGVICKTIQRQMRRIQVPNCGCREVATRFMVHVSQPGKLIAIEGVDGSGKRTQTDLLSRALVARGISCRSVSFPRYGSFFGIMIARFLNGEFGELEAVDPHFAALLYAGNRLEAKAELDAALAAGKTVLADRYVASNMAHQGSRVAP